MDGKHVVCTHEQADFDAIASMIGVTLLDTEAIAVLPRRLNRNVQSFLTLYGTGFQTQEFADLDRERITRFTLVDSQSLPSVKGMTPETEVFIIDHHPAGENLPEVAVCQIETVGAVSTLIVEQIQAVGLSLDPTAATLLLLGIYEDTGSLSYAGTTSRDVQACAWLLDQGASLVVASDFLGHPLSNGQRQLYDRLIETARTHTIQGISVLIACARADGLTDEISTLAHKLRDVFEPDGLFVLVALDGSVQMVARSTSNSLDVGEVAEHFGGGGHSRAAAALVRDQTLDQLCQDLLEYLEQVIEPPIRVAEIMSREPQVLSPETRIHEALEKMQRFGHEGYPVVEENSVVGLLTRRAVDRAMSHGMGENPIAQIMEAGSQMVLATDSVQHMQRVMMMSGWGQLPVADAESGEIIGIVTRTDLINTYGRQDTAGVDPHRADLLEGALPPERLALLKLIIAEAEARGDALYIVGGFVRDLLLEQPSVDFDLVVEGDAIGLAQRMVTAYGGRASSHRRFGTAKWQLDATQNELQAALSISDLAPDSLPASLDFVSARTEFYPHPTALPSVEQGSIKLDLHRRDFTINTLALRLDGAHYAQLLDHWGGGRDLQDGVIRVLHSLSFIDDPTRMLRAVRLEQRLGFRIEPRTMELLEQALPLLDRVSGERIRSELDAIFAEPEVIAIMERLEERGLLKAIHPAFVWENRLADRFAEAIAFESPSEWGLTDSVDLHFLLYSLCLSQLPQVKAKELCNRLRFPLAVERDLLDSNHLFHLLEQHKKASPASQYVEWMEDIQERALVAGWMALEDDSIGRNAIVQYLVSWRKVVTTVDGETLRQMELPPSPAYKEILWRLRAAWLDGQVTNDEEEQQLMEKLVEEARGEG